MSTTQEQIFTDQTKDDNLQRRNADLIEALDTSSGFQLRGEYPNIPQDIAQRINELDENSQFVSSRIIYHMRRLCESRRTAVEQVFGTALVSMLNPIRSGEIAEINHVMQLMLGQNQDTTFFWTYAPYIYDSLLHSQNIDLKRALQLTLYWAHSGQFGDDLQLEGLAEYNKAFKGFPSGKTLVLPLHTGRNERQFNTIHNFVRQDAKRIVDGIILPKYYSSQDINSINDILRSESPFSFSGDHPRKIIQNIATANR